MTMTAVHMFIKLVVSKCRSVERELSVLALTH